MSVQTDYYIPQLKKAEEMISRMAALRARLETACSEMKAVIKHYGVPEEIVRRNTSFEVAEFIYSDEPLR